MELQYVTTPETSRTHPNIPATSSRAIGTWKNPEVSSNKKKHWTLQKTQVTSKLLKDCILHILRTPSRAIEAWWNIQYMQLLGLLELSWFFASCICYSLSWLFLPQLCRRHSNNFVFSPILNPGGSTNLCMSGWHQWMSPHHLKLKPKPGS